MRQKLWVAVDVAPGAGRLGRLGSGSGWVKSFFCCCHGFRSLLMFVACYKYSSLFLEDVVTTSVLCFF